jgi:SNARE protein
MVSRLIKDFERVSKDEAGHTDPATAKMLHDRKQSMVLLPKLIA